MDAGVIFFTRLSPQQQLQQQSQQQQQQQQQQQHSFAWAFAWRDGRRDAPKMERPVSRFGANPPECGTSRFPSSSDFCLGRPLARVVSRSDTTDPIDVT